jgi:hypothetical protein
LATEVVNQLLRVSVKMHHMFGRFDGARPALTTKMTQVLRIGLRDSALVVQALDSILHFELFSVQVTEKSHRDHMKIGLGLDP